MSEKSDRIIEGLAEAVKAETDGYHFYMMASSSTQDEKGKEVFEQLAQEELTHVKFLKAQHDSLKETGKIDPNIKLGRPADRSGMSPIFSPNIKTRAKEAHYEMSALSIGIQLELSAVKHYKTQANAADDTDIKAFFNELAEWESSHHDALSRQLEELRDDYWAAGGFSPF